MIFNGQAARFERSTFNAHVQFDGSFTRFSAHILLDAQQLSNLMHLPKFNADDALK
jgi:hypothetical protein